MLLVLALSGFGALTSVDAQERGDTWDRAVEAVQFRRYAEAAPLLEVFLDRRPADVEARRLLATVYEMRGDVEGAERILREGAYNEAFPAAARGAFAFELGVLLYRQEQRQEAVEMYTASIQHDAGLVPVYLNRANARVALGEYNEAIRDYERYLALRPRSSQENSIRRMISLLTETIDAEEQRRADEEQRRREEEEARRIAAEEQRDREERERREAEEARRVAEEARRVAEEERRVREERERREAAERRQRMMDSVLESLGSARDEARSVGAERETIRDFDDELDIMD